MIIVLVYAGGEIQHGATGVEYNIASKLTFPASEATTFDDVKKEIYEGLGYSNDLFTLSIKARFDIGAPGPHYFQLVPIYEDRGWQMIFKKTIERTSWQVVELYVECTPAEARLSQINGASNELGSMSQPKTTHSTPGVPLDSSTFHSIRHDDPQPHVHRPNSNLCSTDINPSSLSYSTQLDHAYETLGTEYEDVIEEMDIEEDTDIEQDRIRQNDDDEHESDYSIDNDSEEEVTEPRVVHSVNEYPFIRGFGQHSVKAFHDISVLRDTVADESFFGRRNEFSSPLSEHKIFDSKEHLKIVIDEFHITANREVKYSNSSQSKLVAVCTDDKCKWRLYATPTKIGSSWKIKKCPYSHTCRAPADRFDHSQLSANMVANVIRDALKDDLDLSIKNVRALVRQRYQSVKPSYNKLWRGREKAIAQLFGSWEESYALLAPFLEAIKVKNPGTKYVVLSKPTTREGCQVFQSAAWAFGPCIEAAPHLRPVISVDACFLSGRYKGRLLIACGYDGNNQLLPLAFGIVEKEDSNNWGWFMRWLRKEVIGFGKFMCVISDRHKAIKWLFKQPHIGWNETAGQCVHRLCSQHVAENLWKACHDKTVLKTFKWLVKKKKPRKFQEGMSSMANICPEAITYLKKAGKYLQEDKDETEKPEKVFQCMDGGYRWGIMTSNGSESLNKVFKYSRRLPVAAIVEETFCKCLEWFVERRRNALQLVDYGKLWSQQVENLLVKRGNKAGHMHVISYGDESGVYEVKVENELVSTFEGNHVIHHRKDFKYKVTLQPNTFPSCDCLKPNLTGVPCAHVLAVCKHRNLNENELVHPCYSSQVLANTWAGQFHPYGNQIEWPPYIGPTIVPDSRLINRGRRKHNRIPMYMDEMQGRRLGHQACRSTRDNDQAGASLGRRHG